MMFVAFGKQARHSARSKRFSALQPEMIKLSICATTPAPSTSAIVTAVFGTDADAGSFAKQSAISPTNTLPHQPIVSRYITIIRNQRLAGNIGKETVQGDWESFKYTSPQNH